MDRQAVTPYYADDTLTLWHGDALTVLSGLPAGSVDCCVTSPPYFGLRDYGVDGQLGAEASPAEYVENMRALFSEVRRVLADDGTLWLNLGNSYAPTKALLGIPWRAAFALQDDGWTLRNSIIWHKPNAMPESVTDRLSTRHENVFLFSKSRRYWFDLDAIRESHTMEQRRRTEPYSYQAPGQPAQTSLHKVREGLAADGHDLGKNPGDVWSIPTVPFPGAHFAVFPPALAERCILAGAKPGGVVLDPFSGSGTTGMVAAKHGRRYVGVDLNAEYLDLSMRTRLAQPGLEFPA